MTDFHITLHDDGRISVSLKADMPIAWGDLWGAVREGAAAAVGFATGALDVPGFECDIVDGKLEYYIEGAERGGE